MPVKALTASTCATMALQASTLEGLRLIPMLVYRQQTARFYGP